MSLRSVKSYKNRILTSPNKLSKATVTKTTLPIQIQTQTAALPSSYQEIPMSSNGTTSNMVSTMSDTHKAALENRGCLEASVLSVYDLPYSEAVPKAVTLSACGLTVRSGPPLARHKERNSFRFSSGTDSNNSSGGGNNNNNGNASDVTKLVVPLRELYQSTLKIRVAYADPAKYLDAELPLRELRIHEQKWLILNLSPPPPLTSEPAAASGETAIQVASPSSSSSSPRRTTSVTEEDMSPPPTIRIRLHLSGP